MSAWLRTTLLGERTHETPDERAPRPRSRRRMIAPEPGQPAPPGGLANESTELGDPRCRANTIS